MSLFTDFHQALGEALRALDEAKGAEDRADGAKRRLDSYSKEIDALSEARAKLKEESDAHLAGNMAKMNLETVKHNDEITELKKQIAALQELHKTQQENAGNTLTDLNTRIGLARKELDAINIERERARNHGLSFARQLMGE